MTQCFLFWFVMCFPFSSFFRRFFALPFHLHHCTKTGSPFATIKTTNTVKCCTKTFSNRDKILLFWKNKQFFPFLSWNLHTLLLQHWFSLFNRFFSLNQIEVTFQPLIYGFMAQIEAKLSNDRFFFHVNSDSCLALKYQVRVRHKCTQLGRETDHMLAHRNEQLLQEWNRSKLMVGKCARQLQFTICKRKEQKTKKNGNNIRAGYFKLL